jgi:hypothetical protein
MGRTIHEYNNLIGKLDMKSPPRRDLGVLVTILLKRILKLYWLEDIDYIYLKMRDFWDRPIALVDLK